MLFKDLLATYEYLLHNNSVIINKYIKYKENDKVEHYKGAREGIIRMFQELKPFCDDYSIVFSLSEPNDEEKKLYDTMENYPLIGVIRYRKHIIPVYNDDYGQSLFAKIGDNEYSGGTYNIYCICDFCYLFDCYIDKID